MSKLADPESELYTVGPYPPLSSVKKTFANAGHPWYDAKAFRPDELG